MPSNVLSDIAVRWMEFWRGGDLSGFDRLHADNFVDHSPSGRDRDRDSFRRSIVELYAAFPDFKAEIEDIIADTGSNKAAIRWSAVGTFRGDFLGYPATNKIIRFQGIEIIKIADGRVVERWGEWDALGLVEQLSDSSSR
jgi:steroid delta-isomerase-like uncharacterized protein